MVQSDKLDVHSHVMDPEGPMPELQHNMRLLVDMTETEIKKVSARIRHAKDTKRLLEREEQRLRREKAHAEEQRAVVAQAVDVMRALRDDVREERDMASLRKAFADAKAGLGDALYYGQRVHVLRSNGAVTLATVEHGYEMMFDTLYQVRTDDGLMKAAVAEEELSEAPDASPDPWSGFTDFMMGEDEY